MPNMFNDANFGIAPNRAHIERSAFPLKAKRLFTGNAGDLIPFYWKAVVPGDTIKIDTAAVVRMQTPLYPVMDNAVLDYRYFYVPERLVWAHFQDFLGEDNTDAWTQPTEYTQPKTTAPASTGWAKGTIADYLGFRINTPGIWGQSTLFRSYVKVWNDWWRDENLKDPADLHTDDANTTGSNGSNYITDAEAGGMPLKAAKIKNDPFVSALPTTQKGYARLIPLSIDSVAPVFTGSLIDGLYPRTREKDFRKYSEKAQSYMKTNVNGIYTNNDIQFGKGLDADTTAATPTYDIWGTTTLTAGKATVLKGNGSTAYLKVKSSDDSATLATTTFTPINLWADTAGLQLAGTINDLRTSIAIQQILELYARGGTRYRELLANIYNVQVPDATLQRSEFLCMGRIPINMDQVLQTSSTGANTTPLGETGAFSNTAFKEFSFEKGITEHGYIIGVCVIRRLHATYSQNVPLLSQRQTRWDYFFPQFVHLGEEPIYNKYIYADGSSADDEVFGYNERYFAYHYDTNMVMGEMRPDYAQSLDAWHYGDDYATLPTLSSGWIDEDATIFNRTLAVANNTADQFLFDFYLEGSAIRPMPVHSIPGLTRL